MSDEAVLYETDAAVGIITLNRPASLNAISRELRACLADAFRRADDDPATRAVVLRAEGRSFCAGYDISTGEAEKDAWRHDALRWHEHLTKSLEFEMTPWYMRKPVIASVQGHALGGGCELTMFCDLTIAADNALFGEPEIRFSNVGPAIVMPWIIGYKKARELLYLGDMIDAGTALELGMVNRVVPLDELKAATLTFARRLALISPEALYAAKLSINRGADAAGFRNALQAGLDMAAPLYAAKTQEGAQFVDITRKQGLGAALRWRRAQFEAVERGAG
ncbi:MAG TPA: enoyl-CoA hydratase-related protein [Acetobacteraceae bacterium]|nr:enoyl-CoA hydratase-related protein [Acetobacteraceae bacterium]